MKIYDKQICVLEFTTEEIKILESTLRKINGILLDTKNDLTDDEQNIIDDIINGAYEILYP